MLAITRPAINLNVTTGTADCEDCGFYDYGYFDATFPDGTSLSARHDGHLGGGIWDRSLHLCYLWCLAKLGVLVHLDGEALEHRPFMEEHCERGFTEYRPANLLPDNPQVRHLILENIPDPEFPESELPGRLTVKAAEPGGLDVVFMTVPAEAVLGRVPGALVWDGDLEVGCRLLLEQHADLVLVETHERDDDDLGDGDDDLGDCDD